MKNATARIRTEIEGRPDGAFATPAVDVRILLDRIEKLEDQIRIMLSRVETAVPPFGKGMEIRVIISALDLVSAYDPHQIIDYTIDNARHKLHEEANRLGMTLTAGPL